MAKSDGDGLFLLEVLVDKIVFMKSPCFPDKDFRTCVRVEAAGVEPLEICDDEPGSMAVRSGSPFVKNFNIGKSCLFSLKEASISAAMSKFPIKVSVFKSLPCGCLPTKIVMGEATIDMTKEFVQARKTYIEDPTAVSYQALKDSFRIMAPDGADAGEVKMFLRITCFGKLIVTRFQGTGPPAIGAPGAATNAVINRTCNPPRDFQTRDEPCVCGAARAAAQGGNPPAHEPSCPQAGGGGHGLCPTARDPYNSTPCQDPDDPCYCCGPRPGKKDPMACRNTEQYCLHVPKGKDAVWPVQELPDEEDSLLKALKLKTDVSIHTLKARELVWNNSVSDSTMQSAVSSKFWMNMVEAAAKPATTNIADPVTTEFYSKETTVYMTHTLLDQFCRYRHWGTQATASVNKCLQVHNEKNTLLTKDISYTSSIFVSPCSTTSNFPYQSLKSSDVYFFGRHKEEPVKKTSVKSSESRRTQAQSNSSSAAVQTKGVKSVSIKEEPKEPCPARGISQDDVMVTVSHVKIGPKEQCPVHGPDPCMGPKCAAANQSADYASVKVTSMSNPRRGVFELVVRRLTGAPLAKNELMLEWTPPPCRPCPPCGAPCFPGTCRASKLVLCRSPCRVKPCKKPCKRPCGKPCRPPPPCRKCCVPRSCCKKPCNPVCSACPRPPRPSCAQPCPQPCCKPACLQPCCSPCLRPCPVGRRKPRRCSSQPKIRAHRKLRSPCRNRSPTCPVVRCRSLPSPCSLCCPPVPCPPAKCCTPPSCRSCSSCCD